MGFFDLFRRKPSIERDLAQMSAIGDDPNAWGRLSKDELSALVLFKCLEYGITADDSRIGSLFALYRHATNRLDRSTRLELLDQVTTTVEAKNGDAYVCLMMFLAAESDPAIRSSAAMNLAALWPLDNGDELTGPKAVVEMVLAPDGYDDEVRGVVLGGILLLGDRRLLPLLEDAWSMLSDDARIEMTEARSGFVNEAVVEFWLRCLEDGCSDEVFGAVAAAMASLPVTAQVPFVIDAERVFPTYADIANPLRVLRQSSFRDYLDEIRTRLEALEQQESEPEIIPEIYRAWENADDE